MQRKLLVTLFAVLLFLIVVSFLLLQGDRGQRSAIDYAPVATLQVLDEKNKQPNYTIHIEYPMLSNVPSPSSQEKINTAIKTFVKDTADAFKNEISENNQRGNFPSILTMQYSVDKLTKGQFVVTFTIADFPSGVKQPKKRTKTLSFDL